MRTEPEIRAPFARISAVEILASDPVLRVCIAAAFPIVQTTKGANRLPLYCTGIYLSLGRLRRSGWAAGDRGWLKTKSRNRWSWREHQLVHFTYVAMFIYVLYFSSLLHTMCLGCFFDSFGNKFVESKLAVWLFVAVTLLVVSVLYVKCTM